LINALDYNKDHSIRQSAAVALGQISDPQAVGPLIAALRDEDFAVRRAAAEALGQIGDRQAVEPLISSLRDGNRHVRYVAVLALERLDDPLAIEPLEVVCKDRDEAVQAVATVAQAMIGDNPVMQLTTSLKDQDPNGHLHSTVVEALARLGSTAVEPLIVVFNDKAQRPEVRIGVARALGKIGDPKSVDSFAAALKAGEDELLTIRVVSAKALGQIGDPRAVPELLQALEAKSGYVREAAAWSLGQIGDNRAIMPLNKLAESYGSIGVRATAAVASVRILYNDPIVRLVKALEFEEYPVREAAAKALVEIGGSAVESLIAAFTDEARPVQARAEAAKALGQIGDVRAVEPLISAFMDEPKPLQARAEAAKALGQIGDPQAVEPLITTLSNKTGASAPSRMWSAVALRQIGDTRAVEPLIKALEDEDERVREAAVEALGEIGDRKAVEPLIAVLKRGLIKKPVVRALGQIGDTRATEPLMKTLKDEKKGVQEETVKALTLLNWEPKNNLERAWLAFANTEWDELVSLGPAAVGPLIRLAGMSADYHYRSDWGQVGHFSPDVAERAVTTLQQVLEHAASEVTSEDLHAVTTLDNAVKITYSFEDCGGGMGSMKESGTEPIDCSQVKQLGRQELIRRGLKE
jgi:HEAT repeat protein